MGRPRKLIRETNGALLGAGWVQTRRGLDGGRGLGPAAVCHSGRSCSAFRQLHDASGGALERDELAPAGKRNRIIERGPPDAVELRMKERVLG
jgi:hypothetical protein